ncbi:unnamed protein product [Porites lobata]|uniref:Uncharacterized protein n=1 Tax=Porites lobata TaxID=104759 RepID=A0ABN8Q8C0_9CNID|nr:unnamed protein product [Porites lobata]
MVLFDLLVYALKGKVSDGNFSTRSKITSAVSHGTVLGPLLFLMTDHPTSTVAPDYLLMTWILHLIIKDSRMIYTDLRNESPCGRWNLTP